MFRVETWSTGGSTRGINHGDGKDRGSKSRRVSLGRKAHGAGTGTGKGPWPPLCEGRGAVGRKEVGTVAVPSLSRVRLFATLWTAAHQASLSFTISRSLLRLLSIELVMPSNHLILCHPLLFLPSIFPSFRVFSSESALHIEVLELQLQSPHFTGILPFWGKNCHHLHQQHTSRLSPADPSPQYTLPPQPSGPWERLLNCEVPFKISLL